MHSTAEPHEGTVLSRLGWARSAPISLDHNHTILGGRGAGWHTGVCADGEELVHAQDTVHTWNETTIPVTPAAPVKPMRKVLSAESTDLAGTTCQSCKNPDSSKPHSSLPKFLLNGEVEEQDMETASTPIFGLRYTDKYKTPFHKPA